LRVNTKRLCELGLLTAAALIIFVVELWLPNPFPIPGIKLGLANIITVFAVYRYRAGEVFAVVIARILLGAVFAGNLYAVIYSLSGAALCLAGMLVFRKFIDERHLWISSVFGAVLHNTGQLLAAVLLLGTPQILLYWPFLLLSGCLSGFFTGLCAQLVAKRLKIGSDNSHTIILK
jgi:heptaprenyl diphosphate synthase